MHKCGSRIIFRRYLQWLLVIGMGMFWVGCNKDAEPQAIQATAPPVDKVTCDQVMEWVRMRPMSKACQQDSDCVLQRDDCCDVTAVNKQYGIACERTCQETCPQDSAVGTQLVTRATCRQNVCEVALSPTSEKPSAP